MSKLTEYQSNWLRLVKRSKPQSDGRYKVSKTVSILVPANSSELFLYEPDPDGGGFLTLTPLAKDLMEWTL